MSPEAERLIELATRPLAGNAELHLAAAGELRRQIGTSAATPEDLSEAADSLERADRHPRRRWWRVMLYLTTLLVSLPVVAQMVRQLDGFTYVMDLMSSFGSLGGSVLKPDSKSISPQQRLLLFGDSHATNEADRWKPLWDSDPGNPVFLAQYASAYFSDSKKLSPEILDAAAKIDPDNGWFIALAAAGIAEGSATMEKRTDKEKKEFKTPVFKIDDRKKLNEVPSFVYVVSQTTQIVHIRKLMDSMSAGAQECAKNQDVEGFRRIVRDWESLSRKLTENGLYLVDLLVAKVVYTGPAENFRDAAQSLGLAKVAARFADLYEWKKADKIARDQRRGGPTDDLVWSRGSLLAGLTIVPMIGRLVESTPPLTDADLRPGRYADHALFLRVGSMATWALLGLAAGLAALHRFRQNQLVRLQSIRMLDLLRSRDWLWVPVCGIVTPALWYLAIAYLTPLSSREWSFKESGGLQALCQFGSMLVLMLVLSVVFCSSLLGKRGAALGLSSPALWLGWLAALSGALAIPAFGSVLPAAKSHSPLEWFTPLLTWSSQALLAFPVLWLLVGSCRNLLGLHVHALRRATLARMVIPAWIFGMLMMAVSMPVYHAEERRWIQQDRLFELNADKPAMSRYEWEVTQQLRKELLEMMESAQ